VRKRTILLSVLFLALLALPALALELQLDVTPSAGEAMAEQGSEWYVRPGTYRGY
jgi:hypothetical protein